MVWRNTVSNIVLYASQVLLLLWYTRYLLQHFGPGIYGLVPLATTVTAYLGLLLISLNGAVGRFLAKDVAGGDVDSAQVTFSTALWGGAAASAALLPVAALVAFGVPAIMNVPAGQEWPARVLFFAVLGSFLLLSAVNALSTVAFARNRLDLQNLVLGVQVLMRVVVSVVLISGAGWALGAVSVGMLCAGLVGLAGAVFIWRLLAPELALSWRRFSLRRLRQMLRMGGWILVNQGGALLFENSDIIIANLLWGAYAGGRYAAVVLFAATLRAAGSALASPLLPPIVHRFAQGRRDWVVDTTKRGQRLLTLAVGLPVALVCGFSPVILVAWLGPGYRGLWPIAVTLTVYLGVKHRHAAALLRPGSGKQAASPWARDAGVGIA